MKKNTKKIISIAILLSFLILPLYNKGIYSQTNETNIDLLINNKKNQDELKDKINKLEEKINNKKQSIENLNNNLENENQEQVEIVTLSFIDDDNYNVAKEEILKNSINLEIEHLLKEKNNAEKDLESFIIEGVQIEKNIEQEKKEYLRENNLEYISGIWPLESYKDISSPFGERIHPISGELKFHKGIDIPAPKNTDILAIDDGIVIFSGVQSGYGNVVKIKHFDDKETIYAHNTSNNVIVGDIVKQGEVIAKIGSTGYSTGDHVHFETRINGNAVDPLSIVSK